MERGKAAGVPAAFALRGALDNRKRGNRPRQLLDITFYVEHHGITMRTTLDVANDVLDAARALAVARRISVGAALSELARRGVAARTPLGVRNGFPVFQVPAGTPSFGPDEVAAAAEGDDLEAAHQFLSPGW
jgi:hypothetical protein